MSDRTGSTASSTEVGFRDGPAAVGESVARGLLQIKAVEIRPTDPFTWSSGWKSPIYCDNRVILGYPVLREHIIAGFCSIVEELYPGVDSLSGAATGGIAHAAFVADRLGIPMSYVRGSAKGHGRQKQVEGYAVPGSKTLVIEDTLSTGKSAYEAAAALQAEGIEVLGVLSIFSYDFDATLERIRATGLPAHRLVSYETLIQTAVDLGYIRADAVSLLLRWRQAPEQFGR